MFARHGMVRRMLSLAVVAGAVTLGALATPSTAKADHSCGPRYYGGGHFGSYYGSYHGGGHYQSYRPPVHYHGHGHYHHGYHRPVYAVPHSSFYYSSPRVGLYLGF